METKRNRSDINLSFLKALVYEDGSRILNTLTDEKCGFCTFLGNKNHTAHEVYYAITLIAKACENSKGNTNDEKTLVLLREVVKNKFVPEKVFAVLNKFVNGYYEENVDKFLSNFVLISRMLLNKMSLYLLVKNTMMPALQSFAQMLKNKGESTKLSKIQLENLEQECQLYFKANTDTPIADQNFRNVSVLPQSGDVISMDPDPLLKPNIIDKPYDDVEHYLGVHFRLVHADMMRTFCESISAFKNDKSGVFKNLLLYRNVSILYPPKYTTEGVCHTIKFRTERPKNFMKLKQLLPGGIVFMSHNDFKSLICATIKANDMKDGFHTKCSLDVLIEDKSCEFDIEKSYTMIETTAYFECYRHVLEAYKDFNADKLPLQEYIVKLDASDPFPDYVKKLEICLHEKCGISYNEECECNKFKVLETEEWPTAEQLKLHVDQHQAFQMALSQKLSIIQGPPGTGKTFIGVKIVKAFLENYNRKPIVVTCVTNHALDQFMHHLLKHTKKIVRVGQQSKSKVLVPFTLSKMLHAVQVAKKNEYNSDTIPQEFKESYDHACLLAPDLLKQGLQGTSYRDENFTILLQCCRDINLNLRNYQLCLNKYFDEDALKIILPPTFQRNISSKQKISGILNKTVIGWLKLTSDKELYNQCKKEAENTTNWEANNVNLQQVEESKHIYSIDLSVRFKLFFYWRKLCLKKLQQILEKESEEYFKYLDLKIPQQNEDAIAILSGADIIGLTMTGAAKYKSLICNCKPSIMIIEEAAEALESHLVATLVPSIQQLVLIGDHKQLRPLTSNHDLGENYKFNISLFERLFTNNMPSCTITTQFRMRPCIAELLVPEIYTELISDSSVKRYEDVKGIAENLFFLKHDEFESINSSSTSSKNEFEASFIADLVHYFLQFGYEQSQITVLSMYSAQILLMNEKFGQKYPDVQVTTVDSYQGEENDIIIISFVRSNESGIIGFLKEENRSCVALSRARKGLYCIGNFQMIAARNEFWSSVIQKVQDENRIGYSLPLKCQIHDTILPVHTSEEMANVLQHGCTKPCGFRLPCNHVCPKLCHVKDADHTRYKCPEPCEKLLDGEPNSSPIKCKRRCFETCKRKRHKKKVTLECGHRISIDITPSSELPICKELMPKLLPCGHVDDVLCNVSPMNHKCSASVRIKLPCGHLKLVSCGMEKNLTGITCNELKPDVAACGHHVDVPCYVDADDDSLVDYCQKTCNALLDCGHECIGPCQWCFNYKIHPVCSYECSLTLSCGHACKGICGAPCAPCEMHCELSCPHAKCINPCNKECVECKKLCERSCQHQSCSYPCYKECKIGPCKEPCSKILNCSHQCIGLCGDPCPSLCRVCNKKSLKTGNPECDYYVLLEDCGHVVEVNNLTAHIDDCICVKDWPSCPVCSHVIRKSKRFSDDLKRYKRTLSDHSELNEEIYFLFHTMFDMDSVPTWRFVDVHKRIEYLLEHKHHSYAFLRSLKECILSLHDLISIEQKIPQQPAIEDNIDTLILWITRHLEIGSFQQFKELKEQINYLTEI